MTLMLADHTNGIAFICPGTRVGPKASVSDTTARHPLEAAHSNSHSL